MAPMIFHVIIFGGLACALGLAANQSTCVSNHGRPYSEENCHMYSKVRGCIWQHGQCVCREGGYYSKTGRRCVTSSNPQTTQSTATPAPVVVLQDSNGSACVSNRGLPYDEANCQWYGKDRGCTWQHNQCVCQSGGYYSKTGRRCVHQHPVTTQTTTTATSPAPVVVLQDSNGSACVSNRGLPYDEANCQWYGKDRGCIWQQNQCVCQNGGYYSKTGRKCWPPATQPTTQGPAPSPPHPATPKADGSFLDYMVSWFPGPHWLIGAIEGFLGMCSCACIFPCTRQQARRLVCRRRIKALQAPRHEAMLLDEGHVEVVSQHHEEHVRAAETV